MKLRVFGFQLDTEKMPKALTATSVFEMMSANPGQSVGKYYRVGAQKVKFQVGNHVEEWWGGMILKIRDSKAFTVFDEAKGRLTAEELEGNRRLAELNFFIAHPRTGAGLYGHHYHSASITNFSFICYKIFNDHRRQALAVALDRDDLKKKEILKIREAHDGSLRVTQTCRTDNLKKLMKSLRRVNSIELKLATVNTRQSPFRGLTEKARTETVKFTFPPDVAVAELADLVEEETRLQPVSDVDVRGESPTGEPRHYRAVNNPFIFDELEYEAEMGGLDLDLNNWQASIASSGMLQKLTSRAQQPSIRQLIESQ